MQEEKALLIKSFKTKRLDGHTVRTIYALTERGIIQIERRIVSTELNEGFIQLRKFGKWFYQYERMVFKLESFIKIAQDIGMELHNLDLNKVYSSIEVDALPNEKKVIKIVKQSDELK